MRGQHYLLRLHPLPGTVQELEHLLPGLLAVHLHLHVLRVVQLDLGVGHLLLEASQGLGHLKLALAETREEGGDLGIVESLIKHQHQVIILPALPGELNL